MGRGRTGRRNGSERNHADGTYEQSKTRSDTHATAARELIGPHVPPRFPDRDVAQIRTGR
jgi:hypothetical protein